MPKSGAATTKTGGFGAETLHNCPFVARFCINVITLGLV